MKQMISKLSWSGEVEFVNDVARVEIGAKDLLNKDLLNSGVMKKATLSINRHHYIRHTSEDITVEFDVLFHNGRVVIWVSESAIKLNIDIATRYVKETDMLEIYLSKYLDEHMEYTLKGIDIDLWCGRYASKLREKRDGVLSLFRIAEEFSKEGVDGSDVK